MDISLALNEDVSLLRSAYLWFGSYSRHMLAIFPTDIFKRSNKRDQLTLAMPIGEAASDMAGAIRWSVTGRSKIETVGE